GHRAGQGRGGSLADVRDRWRLFRLPDRRRPRADRRWRCRPARFHRCPPGEHRGLVFGLAGVGRGVGRRGHSRVRRPIRRPFAAACPPVGPCLGPGTGGGGRAGLPTGAGQAGVVPRRRAVLRPPSPRRGGQGLFHQPGGGRGPEGRRPLRRRRPGGGDHRRNGAEGAPGLRPRRRPFLRGTGRRRRLARPHPGQQPDLRAPDPL
ncbi:MAG: hypothetical protein AVDCRST_MAG10-3203, partial [uncultured Acidimicrobiales bacterium]